MVTEQYVEGEEIQEQTYNAKQRHNGKYTDSLTARRTIP